MKTYITIILLSFITLYSHFSCIDIASPMQGLITPHQSFIIKEKREALQHQEEPQNKSVDYSQQKTTTLQNSQKFNKKSKPESTSQKNNQQNSTKKDAQEASIDIKNNDDYKLEIPETKLSINESLMRSEFLHLINTTRAEPVVLYNPLLKTSDLRAQEASIKWSHIRPNGSRWNTILKDIINIDSVPHGENLAQTQIVYKENYDDNEIIQIVKTLHQGLVNSPTHYAVMTNKNYKKVNIGIYIEKKDSWLTITIAQHYIK